MNAEWLEWLKGVDMRQLQQSAATRRELIFRAKSDSEKAELQAELEMIKFEIANRG